MKLLKALTQLITKCFHLLYIMIDFAQGIFVREDLRFVIVKLFLEVLVLLVLLFFVVSHGLSCGSVFIVGVGSQIIVVLLHLSYSFVYVLDVILSSDKSIIKS